MKLKCVSRSKVALSLLVLLLAQGYSARAAASTAPATRKAGSPPAKGTAKTASESTNVNAEVWLEPVPQSTFVVPASVKEGRNPFFTQIVRKRETPKPVAPVVTPTPTPAPVVENYTFVLNGLTSPPRQTAIINGRTFEPGEEAEVKMSNGKKVLIKCVEVRADSAVISVGGQQRELRLRPGF
jgi:hypothetical protein